MSKALESAVVVDPAAQPHDGQVFFGATVTYWREAEQAEETISIVGRDEIDTDKNYVSWMSPIARALLKKREGDEVRLHTPKGIEIIEIVIPPQKSIS